MAATQFLAVKINEQNATMAWVWIGLEA